MSRLIVRGSVFLAALSAGQFAWAQADAFSSATALNGANVTTTGTNVGATPEAGEPSPAAVSGTVSVWWSWVAVNTGRTTFDTYGSNFDTTLGVYTGATVSALTLAGDNNDVNSTPQAKVAFDATAGTTYYIQVNGNAGATGNIALTIFNTNVALGANLSVGAVQGAWISLMAYDPNNATTVYAIDYGAGLYRSANNGASWTLLFLPDVDSHNAQALLVSKKDSGLILLGEQRPASAIWRSADGGATFTNVLSFASANCTALAEGISPGVYYAGITTVGTPNLSRIYKSTNGGLSWSATAAAAPPGYQITALHQFPSGRLVIGTADGGGLATAGGIQYSDTEGASWTSVPTFTTATRGFAYNGAGTLVATHVDATTMLVNSTTDGATWSAALGTFGGGAGAGPLHYHALSDTLFAITGDNKLYRSGNGGAGYAFPGSPTDLSASVSTPPALSLKPHYAVAVDPANVANILLGDVGSDDGIFRTADGGTTWATSNTGLQSQQISLATKDLGTGYRYCANRTEYVYFSSSGLSALKKIFRPADNLGGGVYALTYDIADPKRVFFASTDLNFSNTTKIWKMDNALTAAEDAYPFSHTGWVNLTHPTSPTLTPILSLLVNGSTIYAGLCPIMNASAGSYLYKSTDGGVIWNPVSTLVTLGGIKSLAFDPTNPLVVYAGSGDMDNGYGPSTTKNADGIWKTVDGGTTWVHLNSNASLNTHSPRQISIDPANSQRLWLMADSVNTGGNSPDIFESVNGGASWTNVFSAGTGSIWAMTYASTEGLLVLYGGGGGTSIIGQVPGSGSSVWYDAFNVYGDVQALYPGSVGSASSAGLFEKTGVVLGPAVGGSSGGGGGGGGGCGLTGIEGWLALVLLRVRRRRSR